MPRRVKQAGVLLYGDRLVVGRGGPAWRAWSPGTWRERQGVWSSPADVWSTWIAAKRSIGRADVPARRSDGARGAPTGGVGSRARALAAVFTRAIPAPWTAMIPPDTAQGTGS
ncbi:hypothetical protein GCM10022284_68590 [Streptomyces hundungensis]